MSIRNTHQRVDGGKETHEGWPATEHCTFLEYILTQAFAEHSTSIVRHSRLLAGVVHWHPPTTPNSIFPSKEYYWYYANSESNCLLKLENVECIENTANMENVSKFLNSLLLLLFVMKILTICNLSWAKPMFCGEKHATK